MVAGVVIKNTSNFWATPGLNTFSKAYLNLWLIVLDIARQLELWLVHKMTGLFVNFMSKLEILATWEILRPTNAVLDEVERFTCCWEMVIKINYLHISHQIQPPVPKFRFSLFFDQSETFFCPFYLLKKLYFVVLGLVFGSEEYFFFQNDLIWLEF
jgi:hypothetical protein